MSCNWFLRDMILGLWINVLMIKWSKKILDHWGEYEDIYLLYFYRRIWWLNGLFACEMIRFGSIDWFHFCENWIARTHQDMCFVPWIYTIWNHQASGPSLLWWWHGKNDPILKHSVLVWWGCCRIPYINFFRVSLS